MILTKPLHYIVSRTDCHTRNLEIKTLDPHEVYYKRHMLIGWLREYRLGPFSIFDTGGALLGVYVLAPLLSRIFKKFGLKVERIQWLFLTLPFSVVFHIAIGLETPLVKMVIDQSDYVVVKIALIILVLLGLSWSKIKLHILHQ